MSILTPFGRFQFMVLWPQCPEICDWQVSQQTVELMTHIRKRGEGAMSPQFPSRTCSQWFKTCHVAPLLKVSSATIWGNTWAFRGHYGSKHLVSNILNPTSNLAKSRCLLAAEKQSQRKTITKRMLSCWKENILLWKEQVRVATSKWPKSVEIQRSWEMLTRKCFTGEHPGFQLGEGGKVSLDRARNVLLSLYRQGMVSLVETGHGDIMFRY